MTKFTRRDLGKLAGVAGIAGLGTSTFGSFAIAQGAAKVVVVGGGAGGATVAHLLKAGEPKLDVTLIEANPRYSSSFFSNLYLGGFRSFDSLNHGYDGLTKLGVKVVRDYATDVDTAKKTVRTRGGRSFGYDRLVLSPGIDIKYDSIAGYSREAANTMPHAYNTDGSQKELLKKQIDGLKDGGKVIMVMPNNPFRCPPGPYERMCMIAHIIKTKKPKSKLIVLDPKKAFSKQPVFMEAVNTYYKDIIELNLSNEIDSFQVTRVDPKTKEVEIKDGKKWKGDVVNVIPQQRAGEIAFKAGTNEGDWVPINPENFSSTKVKDVYVLGDATVAVDMPKSAFSANSQGKVVAADILADLAKKEKFPARFRNTCWSLVAPDDCIKVGANYAPKEGKLDPSGSFVSKPGEDAATRKQNYAESVSWYDSIIGEMFARSAAPAAKGKKKG
jgi:NADPH-dependent 2,4-dienoyl-CoA reductase/sulfur reductase-like enzyme